MATTILGPKYRSRPSNIPFFSKNQYFVKLELPRKIRSMDDYDSRREDLLDTATDRIIMHYYAELYPGIHGDLETVSPGYQTIYDLLRAEVRDSISFNGYYNPITPPFERSFIVARYSGAPDVIRRKLKTSTKWPSGQITTNVQLSTDAAGNTVKLGLPPMAPVVEYYNASRPGGAIVGADSESTFVIGAMMEDNNLMDNGLRSVASQLSGLPGGVNFNLDFNFLQQDVQKFLTLFVNLLVNQFNTKKETTEFDEADTLTIYFGHIQDEPNKAAIAGMEYLVINESVGTHPISVGYLTNMTYNTSFSDPLTVSMLKNYQQVLAGMQSNMGLAGPSEFSFTTMMDTLAGDAGPGILGPTDQNWEQFDFITPIVANSEEEINEGWAKAAAESGMPVDNKELADGIEAALTSDQVKELRAKVLENPEIAKRVFAEQKAKRIGAAIDVSKKLGRIFSQGPLGFVKKNSPLDIVFRQLGVQEIAKEAFRCLTFGLSSELERINNATQRALTNMAGSIYLPPESQNGPPASITKPDVDLEMFKPFSLTGDIWKQILKSVLDGLRNAVLEIMKSLAALLHELCDFNNPFMEDFGAQDLTDFLPDAAPNTYGSTDSAIALQNMADQNGMSHDALLKYLRAVSSILSSMEICFLFIDQAKVTPELIGRLIAFNKNYDDPYISGILISGNPIMGFFSDLASIIDITELCDKIANALYDLNQDDICLTEGDIADAIEAQNIDSLLDLMENGLQLDLPPISFDCPDKEGFIENPLFNRSVPEALNTTSEVVEMQFITSTEACMRVLLEPSVTNANSGDGTNVAAATLYALPDEQAPQSEVSASAADSAMDMLEDVKDSFTNFADNMGEALADCDATPAVEDMGALVTLLMDIFNDPEFQQAIQNIADRFEDITNAVDSARTGGGQPRATYVFPAAYDRNYNDFLPSVGPEFITKASGEITQKPVKRVIANQFEASVIDDTGIDQDLWVQAIEEESAGSSAPSAPVIDPQYFIDLENFESAAVPAIEAQHLRAWLNAEGSEKDEFNAPLPRWHEYHPDTIGSPYFAIWLASPIPHADNLVNYWVDIIRNPAAYPGDSSADAEIAGLNAAVLNDFEGDVAAQHNLQGSIDLLRPEPYYVGEDEDGGTRIPPWDVPPESAIDLTSKSSLYQTMDLKFYFNKIGNRDHIEIRYPRFDEALSDEKNSFVMVTLNSPGSTPFLPNSLQFSLNSSAQEVMSSHYITDVANPLNSSLRMQTNPYVYTFTKPLLGSLEPLLREFTSAQQLATQEEAESLLFPSLFAGMTKGMFDYIWKNGTFDAPSIRNIQLFKSNEGCPPEAVGDLLDADGILEQVKREFLQSACFDEIPLDYKIRYGVLLSLFFNYIQVEIAEFIIKNIFAFSAFSIGDLIDKPVVAQFMAGRIRDDIEGGLSRRPQVRQAIQNYYNLKLARPPVASQGGILDYNQKVVFPIGTKFDDSNWVSLLEYLVLERLHASKNVVSNIIRLSLPNGGSKKSFDQVFVQDILGFGGVLNPNAQSFAAVDASSWEAQLRSGQPGGSPLSYGTMFLERVFAWDGITSDVGIPEAFADVATGGELEISLFINSFLGDVGDILPDHSPLHGARDMLNFLGNLEFVNPRLQYRLVYYLPAAHHKKVGGPDDSGVWDRQANYGKTLSERISTLHDEISVEPASKPLTGIIDLLADQDSNFGDVDGFSADGDIQYSLLASWVDNIHVYRAKLADLDAPTTISSLPSTPYSLNSALRKVMTPDSVAAQAEVARIVQDPVYKKFFGESFNQELITMIPLYQNFYLTHRYFGKIENVYGSTKNFIIKAFLDVLHGRQQPSAIGSDRPQAAAAIQNSGGPDYAAQFAGLGRDFILKMLIETPIMILKGLAEMIDPHVAIWKVVRNVTGMAFSEMIKAIDMSNGLGPINEMTEELGLPPLTGEDVVSIMLCLAQFAMQTGLKAGVNASAPGALENEEIINNILPKLTLDGVKFTGTLSGMLMIPPLPFGILYILLDLLKREAAAALEGDGDSPELSEGNNPLEC